MLRIIRIQKFRPQNVPSGATVNNICISPDGKKIAYTAWFPRGSSPAGTICIETVGNIGGPGTIRMDTTAGIASNPGWSPDGSHLAYCLYDIGTTPSTPLGIGWIPDRHKPAGPVRLTVSKVPGMNYAWMPSGSMLAAAGPSDLRIVNTGAGTEEKIADFSNDGDPLFPPRIAVSPDGTRIAYTT